MHLSYLNKCWQGLLYATASINFVRITCVIVIQKGVVMGPDSVDHMVSSQRDITSQVTRAFTHASFQADTVLVYHFSNYFYAQIIRGITSKEALKVKYYYDHLMFTHGTRVCVYRTDNLIFWIISSRSQSRILDKISLTVEWYNSTRIQLLNSV